MRIFKNLIEWQQYRKNIASNLKIGFVPTMGCLHAGHRSLLRRSVQENDISIMSLFVNPTQFNDSSDYKNYTKTVNEDLILAEEENIDCVILPDEQALYPGGNLFPIVPQHIFSNVLEGDRRPGHFSGVLTVVMKLLLLVKPNVIYLGEKDYQQYLLIREMVKQYFVGVEVVPCVTVRESSGLPFSSRNTRLSADELVVANQFATIFHSSDKSDIAELRLILEKADIQVEYLSVFEDRLLVAVKIGDVRLIDNCPL